jgi:hypothetical protein
VKFRAIPIEDSFVLQELVIQQIDSIEGQVEVLEIGINTEWGPVILGVDQEGRLVLLVINVIQEDALLSQLIGIYGWISRNMPLISRFYDKRGLDSTRNARVIAISPEFSQVIRDGLACLAFMVELYIYRGLEINGERGILLEPLGSSIPKLATPSTPVPVKVSDTSQELSKAFHLTDSEIRFLKGS